MPETIPLERQWAAVLKGFFTSQDFANLQQFLRAEQQGGQQIFPPKEQIFAALNATPPASVRVVILGQDPYHTPGAAMGFSFSVPAGAPIPPSLQNIFKELKSEDSGFQPPASGDLRPWADQGVLLLNSVLTVRARTPASHAGKGWEALTDAVVQHLSAQRRGIIFLLWGRHAQEKGQHINRQRHTVLEAAHPSPFSADRGFFGCGHFATVNKILRARGEDQIRWQL